MLKRMFNDRKRQAAAALLVAGLCPTALAGVADQYRIDRLGFTGPGFIRESGSVLSTVTAINQHGQVIGVSARYDGSDRAGTAGWIDDGNGPIELGLFGAGYINSYGQTHTNPIQINAARLVIGTTGRYVDGNAEGRAAWIDDGSGATRLGFVGRGYVREYDDEQVSEPQFLNEQGLVAGYSVRFNPDTQWFTQMLGQAAWLDNGTGPTRIGYFGPGYQKTDNDYAYSAVQALNGQGLAAGYSERFDGSTPTGQVAWLDNGTGPNRIGLTGGAYQDSNGVEVSSVQALGEQGLAMGWSDRYNASQPNGRAAWRDSGAGPVRLGFTGSAYTSSDTGRQHSEAVAMNAHGAAIGVSERYDGANVNGQVAWIDDGSGPRRLGFTGGAYQRAIDGFEDSAPMLINGQGTVAGRSTIYNGLVGNVGVAWIDDGSGPIRVGLFEDEYINPQNGSAVSLPRFLNDKGQAAGISNRYSDSGSTIGPVGWFYDPDTQQTSELLFSVGDNDQGWTQVRGLMEDGTVFGTYALYDDTSNGDIRIFAWHMDDGFADLGVRSSDLSDEEWIRFADSLSGIETGFFAGNGDVASQSSGESAYLIRQVPEPATGTLILFAGMMLARRRRSA